MDLFSDLFTSEGVCVWLFRCETASQTKLGLANWPLLIAQLHFAPKVQTFVNTISLETLLFFSWNYFHFHIPEAEAANLFLFWIISGRAFLRQLNTHGWPRRSSVRWKNKNKQKSNIFLHRNSKWISVSKFVFECRKPVNNSVQVKSNFLSVEIFSVKCFRRMKFVAKMHF